MLWEMFLGHLWLDDIDLVIFLNDLSTSYFVIRFIHSDKVWTIIDSFALMIWILKLSVKLLLLIDQMKLLFVDKSIQQLLRRLSPVKTVFFNHWANILTRSRFIWAPNWQVAFHMFYLSEAEWLQVYLSVIVIGFFGSVGFCVFEIGLCIFRHP